MGGVLGRSLTSSLLDDRLSVSRRKGLIDADAASAPSAKTAPRTLTRGFASFERDEARFDRMQIAVDGVYESGAAGGKIKDHLRRMQAESIEVDDVDVRVLTDFEGAAVAEAVDIGGGFGSRVRV